MKFLILAVIMAVGCAQKSEEKADAKKVDAKAEAERNYAEETVMFAEPEATCKRLRAPMLDPQLDPTKDAEKVAAPIWSVVCRFPDKAVSHCQVDNRGFSCNPLKPSPADIAAAQAAQQASQQAQTQPPVPPKGKR